MRKWWLADVRSEHLEIEVLGILKNNFSVRKKEFCVYILIKSPMTLIIAEDRE